MKLSREEAEQLIDSVQVLSTRVKQRKKEIQIHMQLSNAKTCVVTYDRETHQKSYRLNQ